MVIFIQILPNLNWFVRLEKTSRIILTSWGDTGWKRKSSVTRVARENERRKMHLAIKKEEEGGTEGNDIEFAVSVCIDFSFVETTILCE